MAAKTSDGPGNGKNGGSVGHAQMLSTSEACERLRIDLRYFRKLRKRLGAIDGQVLIDGGWAFPRESLDLWFRRYEGTDPDEDEDAEEEIKDHLAELTAAVSKAGKQVFATGNESLAAVGKLMQGLMEQMLAHDKQRAEENRQMAKNQQDGFALQLQLFAFMKDLMISTGEVEAQKIKSDADQTVRIERTKLAAHGLRMFAPIAKAGFARALGRPELARDAQGETVGEVIASLTKAPERFAKVTGLLDEKQREAVGTILDFATGKEKLTAAIKALKSGMTQEKMSELQKHMTDKELTGIMSLFDEVEDDDEQKEPEKKAS